jgi:SAM-dependent methyltransferase
MNDILKHHQLIWQKKKLLRNIYHEWYQNIIKDLTPGKTLELGSGSGNFKEFKPDIISSDIDPQPWLDMHFDAHNIPFQKNQLSNIVMIDVFHHLRDPIKFLNEAYRVLKNNGRIIMIEPFPSPFSYLIYHCFHPEPYNFNINYFADTNQNPNKNAWNSNQAIPYLIFYKNYSKFNNLFKKKFNIIKKEKFSFILYPLSGGFEKKQLIPNFLVPIVKLFEILLSPFRDILAFRCYLVIQKI